MRPGSLLGWSWEGETYCLRCWKVLPLNGRNVESAKPVFADNKGSSDHTCGDCERSL